jgi:hypothetical protein
MGLCRWWLFNYPVLVGLIWTIRNLQEKIAKALAEFKFCHSGNIFMEPRNYDETYVRYCTLLEVWDYW